MIFVGCGVWEFGGCLTKWSFVRVVEGRVINRLGERRSDTYQFKFGKEFRVTVRGEEVDKEKTQNGVVHFRGRNSVERGLK